MKRAGMILAYIFITAYVIFGLYLTGAALFGILGDMIEDLKKKIRERKEKRI